MPLVHIYLQKGRSNDELQAIGDSIHDALMETWGIPKNDRFHLFHEKAKQHFDMNPNMWGVERSDALLVLHITTSPRTQEMKLNFYKRLPEILNERLDMRSEDIFISINSNSREDWSFGNGQAQLLETEPS